MTTLSPKEFFALVWPSPLLTNETLELRAINRKDGSIKRKFCFGVQHFLSEAEQLRDLEVYFGVATRYGNAGKKSDCYRLKTIWADIDDKGIKEVKDLKPKPDLAVTSGGGVHLYWLLHSPVLVRNEERAQEIENKNRGLCKLFDGDIAAIDTSRILRVPGFLNHKYSPARAVIAYAL